MPKNATPSSIKPFFIDDTKSFDESAVVAAYKNIMAGTATGKYLNNLSADLGIPKPPVFFNDDDKWRAALIALAFTPRHTLEGVHAFLEVALSPKVSRVTKLTKPFFRNTSVGDELTITAGINVGTYTIIGVSVHELLFSPGTFVSTDETNTNYMVGEPSTPMFGHTISTHGIIYVADDGTERLRDITVEFLNSRSSWVSTEINPRIPRYCNVVVDKNAPNEETITFKYYDNQQFGLAELSDNLKYTHNICVPFVGSVLERVATPGDPSIFVQDVSGFPALVGPVPIINPLTAPSPPFETITIHNGVNAGTYDILSVVDNHTIELNAALSVTGYKVNNSYRIQPLPPAGLANGVKGSIVSTGGVISSGATSKFFDPAVNFNELINIDRFTVIINRGNPTEEILEVNRVVGSALVFWEHGGTSLLKYKHFIGESVEIYDLPKTATDGTIMGVATGGTINTAVVSLDIYSKVLVGDEIEFISASTFITPRRRTVTGKTGPTTLDFAQSLPFAVSAGDTFTIKKRYVAGVSSVLYLNNTSWLPRQNFSVVINRGKLDEEVVFIFLNDTTSSPHTLLIANSDNGDIFIDKNHDSLTVELAQIYVPSCGWDLIETAATGEYTILVNKDCLPYSELKTAFKLHFPIPVQLGAAAIAGVTVTDASLIQMSTADYATVLETDDCAWGFTCRPVFIFSGLGSEYNTLIKRESMTRLVQYAAAGDTTICVKYEPGMLLDPPTWVLSRRSNYGTVVSEVVTVLTYSTTGEVVLSAPLTQEHFEGDFVEPSGNGTFRLANPITVFQAGATWMIYAYNSPLVDFKHKDPTTLSTKIQIVDSSVRSSGAESYYATFGQETKPIYPGPYLYDVDATIESCNQPTSNITTLASGMSVDDPEALFRIPAPTVLISNLTIGSFTFTVADTSLFPLPAQNPFYVVINKGKPTEERVQCVGVVGSSISIAATETLQFNHVSGETVHLEVTKLFVSVGTGLGDSGGFYFDYGFRGNSTHIEDLYLVGTQSIPSSINTITDLSAKFNKYADLLALLNAKVIIRPGTPTEEIASVVLVSSSTTLIITNLTNPFLAGENYIVFNKSTSVDIGDAENGEGLTDKVGGILVDSGGPFGIKFPKRTGGIHQDYVSYKARVGNVLILNTPTVFEYGHPSGTELIIGSGVFKPPSDGSGWATYIQGNLLDILFNPNVSSIPSNLSAAGVDIKVEERQTQIVSALPIVVVGP